MAPITSANIEKLLSELGEDHGSAPLELDLGRVERHAGAVLSVALLGTLGDQPLALRVQGATEPEHWLASAGLAFAVANRAGKTTVDGTDPDEILAEWRRTWTPGTRQNWLALFPHEEPSSELFAPEAIGETGWRPDLFGPQFAAFVNPHRTGRVASRHHPLNRAFWPWLERLLPGSPKDGSEARRSFVTCVGTLMEELVSNISEHAAGTGPDVHSLVHASVTRGGEGDRLHLAFADTGEGIIGTLRPKLWEQQASDMTLLRTAFEGGLPGWGVGRGLGLPAVLTVCRRQAATLRVATGNLRMEADGRDGDINLVASGFALRGTVFVISLRLPK
jgi:hypothetical protein